MFSKKAKKAIPVLIVVILMLLTACGGKSANTTQPSSSAEASASGSGEQATTTAAFDPMAKYDPPIEVTSVRSIDSTFKFLDGESIENNAWIRFYEENLGIKLKYLWTVDASQFTQKLNVTIASGDLPDIIPVQLKELNMLVDSDSVMSLDETYEKYMLPKARGYMEGDGGVALSTAKYSGKLMALPIPLAAIDTSPLLWVRTDWLQNLNLPEPKTMQDVIAIAEAFTKQDPDKDGKNDTFGLGVIKDLYSGYAGLDGFFQGYHAYPDSWIKDSSGKLVYGSIQPQVRDALAQLQEMYKTGQIDREFGVKDMAKIGEDDLSGKIGMQYGQMWNPLGPLVTCRDKDPNADWKPYAIPSIDGNPAKPMVGVGVNGYFAINKNMKNPEAVFKMFNIYTIKDDENDPDVKTLFWDDDIKIEFFKYALMVPGNPQQNLLAYRTMMDALKNNTKPKTNLVYYDNIMKFQQGDNSGWGLTRVFGEGGAFSVIDKYVTENLMAFNEHFGPPTPTMTEKSATLRKMELETFSKIIMNNAPITEFDTFVDNWKKLGGDTITQEINDWYGARK